MSEEKKKECMTCKTLSANLAKGLLKSWVSEHGTMFSSAGHRPNAKGHVVVMSKRHADDFRDLTSQEWADILPVVKDSIAKIDRTYHPLGYRISMPTGAKASQNEPPHFYTRVVPKYKKNWGTVSIPLSVKSDMEQAEFATRQKLLQEALQPNQDGVIAEKGKLVAKLFREDKMCLASQKENLPGAIVIATKAHLPNDISALDPETWVEIGQMLKELMAKIEAGTDCHDFGIEFKTGEKAVKMWKEEGEISSSDYPESELIVLLLPKYKTARWWKGERPIDHNQMVGSMENERIALKLRDPEEYAKIWGKKDKTQELGRLQKDLAAKEQEVVALRASAEEKESTSQISPLWLIPTVLVTMAIMALIVVFVFVLKKKVKNN